MNTPAACSRLASRAGWEDHDDELPIVEGTLIRLTVDHLPGDRSPEPLWLRSPRAGTDADAVNCTWQAFWRQVPRGFAGIAETPLEVAWVSNLPVRLAGRSPASDQRPPG